MYKVYGNPRTRARRVTWMLEELGQSYEIVPAGPHTDAILAVNPGGKIPVLGDGDLTIPDSAAILSYLADKHGALAAASGTAERAKQNSLMHFVLDEIEGPLWYASKHSFVLPEEKRIDGMGDVCKWEWEKALGTLAVRMGDNAFAAGSEFTICDIFIAHCYGWATRLGWEIPDPKVADYCKRMVARPAFIRADERGEAAMADAA